jgi:hypothetical protein
MRRRNAPAGLDIEAWGYWTARATGYDAANLRSYTYRARRVRVTIETATRWADEARRTGMKLYTYTNRLNDWKTSAGHTISRRQTPAGTEYTLTAPGWDHPVTFRAAGFLRGIMTLEKHLGPLHLYVDGRYADDEDPATDLMDDPDVEQLELFGADARRLAA